MKPPPEFGKEAMENERKQQIKKKKMKQRLIAVAILAVVSVGLFFLTDIKDSIAAPSKNKAAKNKQQETPTPGIIITKKWDLPKALTEISGLAYLDGDRFACVQDEEGKIFIYNTATSSIEKEIEFGGVGDYEGLTLVNGTAWVVRSDGHLFEVSNLVDAKPAVKEYSTHLTVEQNIEGLCYDEKNNRLLVAIKDTDAGGSDHKGIYAFDLATRKMAVQPVFKIDLRHEIFQSSSGKKKGGAMMPSSIAIHPATGDMYITDGRRAKLLVLDNKGAVRNLYQLSGNEFAQPEGITFKPNGELYISNEGPKQPANILQVTIQP